MFILRMLSLMPEQSETNNHTSECDDVKTPPPPPPPQLPSTSRNLWMVPFLLGGLRIDMFAPKGA